MQHEPLTTAGASPLLAGTPSGEIAFVIDDDPLMAGLLERHLVRRGVRSVPFDDPGRLLAELASAPPDYLFTDLEMPRMRGDELASEARERGFRGTVVLVTASRDHAAVVAAVRRGVDEIVPKPPRDADLDLVLEKARARARRSLPLAEELRAVLDPLDQGAILVDEEYVPFYANARACDILGIASAEEAMAVLEQGGLASQAARGRGEPARVLFIDVAKSAETSGRLLVGFEVHECPLSPKRRGFLVLMHDYSQWRRLDELHSRFATYLSHRMRTPLTSARNAVKILSGKDEPLPAAEQERFLDIGCRNIEKLISSFDELQKLFMVESGEINACRSLVRVARELEAILSDAEACGRIGGFKLRGPDCAVLTSGSRMREYVSNAIDALAGWLGEVPHVECSVIASEPVGESGQEPAICIVLAHQGRVAEGRGALVAHLSASEFGKTGALDRIARSLDGSSSAAAGSLRLRLPAEPAFDRGRDLVHPLHIMLERSGLEGAPFHLVSMRLAGEGADHGRFQKLLETNLCALFGREGWLISRGETPGSYTLFSVGETRERVAEAVEHLRTRFSRCCRERGEELYPAVRWDIRYSRESCAGPGPREIPLVESLF
jgi:FixJ family two-component response regulator